MSWVGVPMPEFQNNSKLRAEARKLEAETRLLTEQFQPRARRLETIKAWGSLGGIAAALAAVITIAISSYQFFENEKNSRKLKIEENFYADAKDLASDKPTARVAAVVGLQAYLDRPEFGSQAIILLTSVLPAEPDPIVRAAILQSISSVRRGWTSSNPQTLNRALNSLIAANQSLMADSATREKVRHDLIFSGTSPTEEEGRLASIAGAIELLLRKGASSTDFSNIYCARCNFSLLSLDHADFTNSFLVGANFVKASLDDTVFEGANLIGANFSSANLRFARLTGSHGDDSDPVLRYATELFLHETPTLDLALFPIFRCANLTESDFSDRAMFLVLSRNSKDAELDFKLAKRKSEGIWDGTDFSGAKMEGVRLDGSTVLVLRGRGSQPVQFNGDVQEPSMGNLVIEFGHNPVLKPEESVVPVSLSETSWTSSKDWTGVLESVAITKDMPTSNCANL
jgi:uncharacterized protein YjbI with pentapeptide repeats